MEICEREICALYNDIPESINHLFFQCTFVVNLWHLIEAHVDMQFEMFSRWSQGAWIEEGEMPLLVLLICQNH